MNYKTCNKENTLHGGSVNKPLLFSQSNWLNVSGFRRETAPPEPLGNDLFRGFKLFKLNALLLLFVMLLSYIVLTITIIKT